MKPNIPLFECKYCHNPEPHDRRACRGAEMLRKLHADPVRKTAYAERGRAMMQAMWDKARKFERENIK